MTFGLLDDRTRQKASDACNERQALRVWQTQLLGKAATTSYLDLCCSGLLDGFLGCCSLSTHVQQGLLPHCAPSPCRLGTTKMRLPFLAPEMTWNGMEVGMQKDGMK